MSVIGLSAAATVTILIVAYLFFPGDLKKEPIQTTRNITADTLLLKIPPAIINKKSEAARRERPLVPELKNILPDPGVSGLYVTLAEQSNQEQPDSITGFHKEALLSSLAIPVPDNILNAFRPSANDLQPFTTVVIKPLTGDDRSNVDRFVARLMKMTLHYLSGSEPGD